MRVMKNILLQGIVGSRAYGTNHARSDTDRLAIFLSEPNAVLGFKDHAKSYHLTDPSDLHLHELQRFLALALKGNPTIMELLWLTGHETVTPIGQEILDNRIKLMGKEPLRNAYVGYAKGQLRRHGCERSLETTSERHRRQRQLLHCYRLLMQAESLLATGTLTVRLTEDQISRMNQFKTLSKPELETEYQTIVKKIDEAWDKSSLSEHPDRAWAERFLIKTRLGQFEALQMTGEVDGSYRSPGFWPVRG